MNPKFLLIVLAIAGLSSCTTAYKIGQTPDDVYYSPAPQQEAYVNTSSDETDNAYISPEDQQIRRHINNPRLRRYDYDYDYGYNYPYVNNNLYGYNNSYSYGYGYNSYSYGYGFSNNYYPYAYSPIYIYPKVIQTQPAYSGARKYNLGTYRTPSISANSIDLHTGRPIPVNGNTSPVRTFTKPSDNNRKGVGNLIRKVFSNPDVNTRTYNNDNNQTRTFEPSRSTSNSSSSGSSSVPAASSAPVRTFHK